MGGKTSKTTVDSQGQINNNVIVQDHIEILADSRILLGVLILLKILEFLYIIFRDYSRRIKKYAVRNDKADRA